MIRHTIHPLLSLLLLLIPLETGAGKIVPPLVKKALQPEQLGVIVNDADPLSVKIADYYIDARLIPKENLIHINLKHRGNIIKPRRFSAIHNQVVKQTPRHIQAYALTWTHPYRVGCMSITSAFATGYNSKYCAVKTVGKSCGPTPRSPYFASDSETPFDDLKIRPTMMIATNNFEEAKKLIDRGIRSDGTLPQGRAYPPADKKSRPQCAPPVFFHR